MAHGVVEAQVDRLDRRQVVVFERDVAEQVEQARDGNGPDDGFVAVVEGRMGRAAQLYSKRFVSSFLRCNAAATGALQVVCGVSDIAKKEYEKTRGNWFMI
nr:hypothetical protein [uncultured Janthinobacterium sp.]